MDEFEIMRMQLASVKAQLDKQQIVNNELMRKVMRAKARWMDIFVNTELIAMPLLYLLIAGICHLFGVSQWYSFVYLILGGMDAYLDTRTMRIPGRLFSSSSMIDLRNFLVHQKKERFFQTSIMGALGVMWLIMFVVSIFTSPFFTGGEDQGSSLTTGLVFGITGSAIAVIIIIILYRKMRVTSDSLLTDIDFIENGAE